MGFWPRALHHVPQVPPGPNRLVLKDPSGRGPDRSMNLTSESPMTDYRIHLDLYSSDPEREGERRVGLGPRLVKPAETGVGFVALADPDGNQFDVVDERGRRCRQRA